MRGFAMRSLRLDRSRPLLSANWGDVTEPRRRLVKQAAKAARPESLVDSPLPREEGCANPSDTFEERIWLAFTLVQDEPPKACIQRIRTSQQSECSERGNYGSRAAGSGAIPFYR